MSTALILIDLQNDFLDPAGAYARGGCANAQAQALPERLLPLMQAVKRGGGLIVASQFTLWPDASGEPMISPHLKALRPFLKRGDFAPGTEGQACVDLIRDQVDVVVQKVAYSAFFNTQLDWVLRKAGVHRVLVAGIVTNGGVASTVRDAHMRDYETVVVADGCSAFKLQTHEAALADMASVARVALIAELLHEAKPAS